MVPDVDVSTEVDGSTVLLSLADDESLTAVVVDRSGNKAWYEHRTSS